MQMNWVDSVNSDLVSCLNLGSAVNYLPAMQEPQVMWVQFLGQEDPLVEEMTIHSSILAWKILQTQKAGRLQSIELQRVRHDWSNLAYTHNLNVIWTKRDSFLVSFMWGHTALPPTHMYVSGIEFGTDTAHKYFVATMLKVLQCNVPFFQKQTEGKLLVMLASCFSSIWRGIFNAAEIDAKFFHFKCCIKYSNGYQIET